MTMEEYALLIVLRLGLAWAPMWIAPLLVILIAGRFHAFDVILHDAAHMPLRSKSLTVRSLEILCGYPMATTLNAMRYHHLRHHRDSGMESDPYFKEGPQTVLWWTRNTLRGALLLPFWTLRAVVGVLSLASRRYARRTDASSCRICRVPISETRGRCVTAPAQNAGS